MANDAHLAVFARLPVPGKVKTRLAASVGAERATEIYRAMAEHCFSEASRCPNVDITLFCSVPEEEQKCQAWLKSLGHSADIGTTPQVSSPDLGDRMSSAITWMLARGSHKAMIVGTDIPDISADIISKALRALDKFDMVLGPACDGGYYLIGVSKPLPEGALEGIHWSTDEVFESTKRNVEAAGLTVAPQDVLPVLQDIDYIEDLAAWYTGKTSCRHSEGHPVRKVVAPIVDEFLASSSLTVELEPSA